MSRLLHIILCSPYTEGLGYQENILSRKHKELGYDVQIITYNRYDKGSITATMYINEDGIPVHMLASRKKPLLEKIPKLRALISANKDKTIGLYHKLDELRPDIIFIHGVDCHDHHQVVKYIKQHSKVRLYVDNHCDYYNNPVTGIRGHLFIRRNGAKIGKCLSEVARIMWGVTPWRVKYLIDVYNVPKDKCALLVMGGDESKIDFNNRENIRHSIRNQYGISEDTFLIVSGGKIDRSKNIHILAEAINNLNNDKIKLLLFGKLDEEISSNHNFKTSNVVNVGWIPSDKSYELFLASDVAVFPGTHSVLWEQACACGIPGIFKDWDGGFSHIDVGGNAILLKDISAESLMSAIETLKFTPLFFKMKTIAEGIGKSTFSYLEIAKRSVEFELYENSK